MTRLIVKFCTLNNVCMYVFMHACMYVCMYVSIYVCLCVRNDDG